MITLEDIRSYPLVILGTSSYRKDFPEIPRVLLQYVENGGTLFFSLAECDTLVDPYLKGPIIVSIEIVIGLHLLQAESSKTR